MDDGGLEVVGDDADDDEEEEDGVVFGVWLVGEDEAIVGCGLAFGEGLAWMCGGQSRRLDARGFLPGRGRSLSLSVELEAVDLVVKVVRM